LKPTHPETHSPIVNVEELVAQIAIQMRKICQPLRVSETIDLANGLIKNSELQTTLEQFKITRYPYMSFESLGKVGNGWCNGFMHRHGHQLVTKRGKQFATDRACWLKESYIKQMHDFIHDNMVEAKIAKRLLCPVGMDEEGNIVGNDNKEEIFGLPCDIVILHPDYILFADKTGWKAICTRGWFPPNCNLLLHPEIQEE
jgi:hypothetical protein